MHSKTTTIAIVRPLWLLAGLLLLSLLAAVPLRAEDPVGKVIRVQGRVEAQLDAEARILSPGAPVFQGDSIVTDDQGRVELELKDGSVLTVGGSTRFNVDEFVYDPEKGLGKAAFSVFSGAFRLITGGVTKLRESVLEVSSPLATIGVRGTDFWGGWIRDEMHRKFGVLMLEGTQVAVRTKAGSADLTVPGQGVWVHPGHAPTPPAPWKDEDVRSAIGTIAFQ